MARRTWVYVWLDGEPVGFVGDAEGGEMRPFGAISWTEEDGEGVAHRIRCEAFDREKTGTIEEAKARLGEWLTLAGVYEAVPIVAARRPVPPRSTSGPWTREGVAALVRSVLLEHGADAEDLAGGLAEGMVATSRRGLTLRLGTDWLPLLPSTAEEDVRWAVRAWCAKVKAAWAAGIPYAARDLPRTHARWRASREGADGR